MIVSIHLAPVKDDKTNTNDFKATNDVYSAFNNYYVKQKKIELIVKTTVRKKYVYI